jgi:hypothetical protein
MTSNILYIYIQRERERERGAEICRVSGSKKTKQMSIKKLIDCEVMEKTFNFLLLYFLNFFAINIAKD